MKPVAEMTPEELAGHVCQALQDGGVRVTLTGGASAAIWSEGRYHSDDLDFIEDGPVPPRKIEAVMASLGFRRDGRRFVHSETSYYVEFPTPPLMVGQEPATDVVERETGQGRLRLLSPTDCVKDRLVAFFHWNDRQALEQALMVARAQPIDLKEVRRWSTGEGAQAKFAEFNRALSRGEE